MVYALGCFITQLFLEENWDKNPKICFGDGSSSGGYNFSAFRTNIENKLDNGIFNEQENNHLKKLIQMIINTNTLTGFILPQINEEPLYSEAKS